MIQRIQSVWLLLAAVAAFFTFKLPVYTGTNAKGLPSYPLMATENIWLLLVTGLIAVLALVTIFLFKKRPLQFRLSLLGLVLEILLAFLYYREIKTFTVGAYALAAILQVVIFFSFIFAAKAIRSDEKLVKESNRLR